MSSFTLEDMMMDTDGLQTVYLKYASGSKVEIEVGVQAVVKYNTNDQLLYVFRDGKYHLDAIVPDVGGVSIISSE